MPKGSASLSRSDDPVSARVGPHAAIVPHAAIAYDAVSPRAGLAVDGEGISRHDSEMSSEVPPAEVPSDVDVREIAFGSAAYAQTCRLREEVLRTPLWMALRPEDTAGEDGQVHLAAFAAESPHGPPVGCVVLKPDGDGLKLRQMAVADSHRGRGVGRALVERALAVATARAARSIAMDARRSAEGFYSRLGFETVSEPYEIIGLEHVRMERAIARSAGDD